MKPEIRKAVETDMPVLLEFERGIVETERPFDSTLKSGEIHYYDLHALIQSPDAEVLVAVVNDEIVGSGYVKILTAEPYQSFSRYAYLGFMYVKPAFRNRGINKLILSAIRAWAKNRDLTELRLEVYDKNETAKAAYLKAGFEPNLLKMRMEI